MTSAIRFCAIVSCILVAVFSTNEFIAAKDGATYLSHPPMRPLPTPAKRELAKGPAHFVDGARGNDSAAGTEQAPWKTLRHSLRQLKPGETLYLRGGTYYEKSFLSQSGREGKPITVSSYPGELAVIDGSLREFTESPATSWQPLENGAEGEFVSSKTYFDADNHQVPRQFLPGSWEPMWGIEGERPLALGFFADSLVPLHSYRLAADLRSKNELWIGGKAEMRESGIYCGPGLWFNRETGRIHIRLAHHGLAGLEERAYRGEQDPRELPLVIAAGFGESVLRLGERRAGSRDGLWRFSGATGQCVERPSRYALGFSRQCGSLDFPGSHEISRHGVVSNRPAEQPAGEREHRVCEL
jgi:hypothetical protein